NAVDYLRFPLTSATSVQNSHFQTLTSAELRRRPTEIRWRQRKCVFGSTNSANASAPTKNSHFQTLTSAYFGPWPPPKTLTPARSRPHPHVRTLNSPSRGTPPRARTLARRDRGA